MANTRFAFRILVVAEGFRPQLVPNVDPAKAPLTVKLEAMPSDLSSQRWRRWPTPAFDKCFSNCLAALACLGIV